MRRRRFTILAAAAAVVGTGGGRTPPGRPTGLSRSQRPRTGGRRHGHVRPRAAAPRAAAPPGAGFVIINRAAAGGQLAFETVAQAAPDGYAIGAAQAPNALTLPIERPVRDRVEDFAFFGNVVEDPGGLFVRADSPLRSVADLVAAARRRPGEVTVGTAGIGSDDHLLMLYLQEATGTTYSHVPCNGTPRIVTALLAGDIAVSSFNMSEGLAPLREGTLRALAQGGPARWKARPRCRPSASRASRCSAAPCAASSRPPPCRPGFATGWRAPSRPPWPTRPGGPRRSA